MAKFRVIKRLSLEFLGDEWKECYIKFKALSYNQLDVIAQLDIETDPKKLDLKKVQKASKEIKGVLERQFTEGKGWNGKEIIGMEKNDIGELPAEVIRKSLILLVGGLEKNESGS